MKIVLNTDEFNEWIELFSKSYEYSYPTFMSRDYGWFEQKLNIWSFNEFMTINIIDLKVFEKYKKSIHKILDKQKKGE
mgnify:CR=1 FL=1|tara:strand:- start:480 stop:713 length:234 start_codon:yes stop_codon:yes gene_type:complete